MKKILCILSIAIITIIHTAIIANRITVAGLIGSLLPFVIIGLLLAKYLDKKASKEKKLIIFTIAYSGLLVLVVVNNLGLLK